MNIKECYKLFEDYGWININKNTDKFSVTSSIKSKISSLLESNKDFEEFYTKFDSYKEFMICLKNKIEEIPRCPYCNDKVSLSHGKIRKTCGKRECYQREHERVMTEKYGVPFTWNVESVKEKTRKTFNEKWGVDNAGQSKEIHEKSMNTLLEKNGVPYSTLLPSTRESIRNFNKKIQSDKDLKEKVLEKRKKTMMERFGCEHALQNKEILSRASNTMKKNLGVYWAQQSDEVKKKSIETRIEKYGVEYCAQSEDYAKNINRKYIYNNESFDSSWEIAYLIYSTEVLKEEVIRNYNSIDLRYQDGSYFKYFPDFWNNTHKKFVEIKGNQFLDKKNNLIPFPSNKKYRDSDRQYRQSEKCRIKNRYMKDNVILITSKEILPMIKYVNKTRGKEFFKSILQIKNI